MIKVGTKVYHKKFGKGKVVEHQSANCILVKFKKEHGALHNGKSCVMEATIETEDANKYYWLAESGNGSTYVVLDDAFTFQVGDRVKMKKSVFHPKYGWGKVTKDVVGTIVELGWQETADKLKIDFEVQKSWAGHAPEMTPVELVFPRVAKVVPEPAKEEPKEEEFPKVIIGEKFTYKDDTYQVVPIKPWVKGNEGQGVQVVLLKWIDYCDISFVKTEDGCNDAPYVTWGESGDITGYMKSYWKW